MAALFHKNRTEGSNHSAGSLILLVACVVYVAGVAAATFGVFCWLEVMDLDRFFVFLLFLCFVLHITYTFQLFVVCVVSEAPNST